MSEEHIMKFRDEEGHLVELRAMARIFLEDHEYLILAPLDSEDEEYVFRVDPGEAGEEYNALESDEEFLRVKKEYSRLLYDTPKGDAHE
ncbi:hypothetical protein ABB02_01304 [Clostridiaceae bacterium JG1575]|nr:hypothetical protein ABB02_01304 [Clostridiaceae bacterium JG1575]